MTRNAVLVVVGPLAANFNNHSAPRGLTPVRDGGMAYWRRPLVTARTARLRAKRAVFLAALALPPSDGRAENQTVIHVTYVETHDRLPPVEVRDVEKQHDVTATLSQGNHVTEQSTSFNMNRRRSNPTFDEDSTTIGDNSGRVVWHVIAERKLQRIFVGQQMLVIMNIDIDANNQCQVDVKYLQQEGFTDIVAKRADNGEMAHFTLPRVKSASCAIH
jgi:hypothetical protein